jgi:TPR repeat protein
MSSPVHDSQDGRSMYAPPWARDEQNDEDTRRVQAEIASAAERLKAQQHASRAAAQQALQARREEARAEAAKALPGEDQFEIENAIRDAWVSSRLDPVRMPPPPKADGPTWGMLSRVTGAAGFMVIVALFVTGVIPMPKINISLSRDDRGSRITEAVAARPEPVKQVANVPMTYATQPTFAPRPAAPLPSTVGVAMTTPVAAPAPAMTASVQPVARPEPPRLPQAAVPQARGLNSMSLDEIESLLTRGHEMLSGGDVAGGRLLLTRAAEAGEARASLALAGSYDAPVMGYLGVVGVPPDPVKARAWYLKAAEQGSPEAVRRLERLAGR